MIDSNTYLICYMDILGYSSLIYQNHNNTQNINELSDCLENILINLDNANNTVSKKWNRNSALSIKIISDSVLLVIPLRLNSEKAEIKIDIANFLFNISYLYLMIPHCFGHFLRGNICLGQFFEKKIGPYNSDFIFSKALVDAVSEEKEAAWPRITVEKKTRKIITSYLAEAKKKNIFKDIDNLYSLDIYNCCLAEKDDTAKSILKNFAKIAHEQIKNNKNNNKNLHKYIHLAEYHNKKIKEYNFIEDELKIKI